MSSRNEVRRGPFTPRKLQKEWWLLNFQILVTEKDLFSFAAENGQERTNLRAAS
jgi:hypothetical protein